MTEYLDQILKMATIFRNYRDERGIEATKEMFNEWTTNTEHPPEVVEVSLKIMERRFQQLEDFELCILIRDYLQGK